MSDTQNNGGNNDDFWGDFARYAKMAATGIGLVVEIGKSLPSKKPSEDSPKDQPKDSKDNT